MILISIEEYVLNQKPKPGDVNQYKRLYNYCKFLQQKLTLEMVWPKETALIKNIFIDSDNDETGQYEYLTIKNGAGVFYRKLPDGEWDVFDCVRTINEHIDEYGEMEVDDAIMGKILNA